MGQITYVTCLRVGIKSGLELRSSFLSCSDKKYIVKYILKNKPQLYSAYLSFYLASLNTIRCTVWIIVTTEPQSLLIMIITVLLKHLVDLKNIALINNERRDYLTQCLLVFCHYHLGVYSVK